MTEDESMFSFLIKKKGDFATFGDNAKERIIWLKKGDKHFFSY